MLKQKDTVSSVHAFVGEAIMDQVSPWHSLNSSNTFSFALHIVLVVTSFTHNIPLSLQYIHDNFKKGRQYSKTGGVDKCEKVFLKLVAVLRDKFK